MGCNNKHILEGNNEGEKQVGMLLSYVDDEIKGDIHENIVLKK